MSVHLVAGGAGFIGSHLCEKLINQGQTVWCVDNLSTGSEFNIRQLAFLPNFSFFNDDVCDFKLSGANYIWNLACPASPVHYQRDPIKTATTCFMGSLNLLKLAEKSNARILQASTSEVYGDPHQHPQKESYFGNVNCYGPRACYDEGKRVAETLFYDFKYRRAVDTRIARIFNTYGPRMAHDDGRVVSNFVYRALKGLPLQIYGDGHQTRSFCFVSDLVDGLLKLMQSEVETPVNLGNPTEFTVFQLAELVISMTKSKSLIERLPPLPDDPRVRRPDIYEAKSRLGWHPQVYLPEGLNHMIYDFRNRFLG